MDAPNPLQAFMSMFPRMSPEVLAGMMDALRHQPPPQMPPLMAQAAVAAQGYSANIAQRLAELQQEQERERAEQKRREEEEERRRIATLEEEARKEEPR